MTRPPALPIRLGAVTIFLALSILAQWRSDDRYFYIESTGFPTRRMMVGITSWQQQVPLPQDFTGPNAFRIPRYPVISKHPVSAKTALFNGAIAVAVNGVPIFNPIKNDGRTDTFLAGELDEFGGHCGRADDYHYHIAPLHLIDVVGAGNPIAYALDGFAIYGLNEADGSKPQALDEFNGHQDARGAYHYHATKTYPYVNGGLRGEVQVEDDHITPQPVTIPVRPAERPLRGARIVGFTWPGPNRYSLEYTVGSEHRFVNYSITGDGTYTFEYVDGAGAKRTQVYTRRKGRGSLSWQREDGGEMTWESAQTYCANLELDRHRDWRLPTAREAFSILDHSRRPPALDPAAFARSEAQYWWTSERRADDPSRVWVTNAGGGIGPHPKAETISAGGDRKIHARCVRGSNRAIEPGWRGAPRARPQNSGWDDAVKFCAAPWRLPAINELQSINDVTVVRPSVNRTMFPDTAQSPYWSSTAMANRPERAWTVDFTFGIVSYEDKTEKLDVRCVRDGAAQ